MSTSTKGGDTTKRVKVAKDNTQAHFIALQSFMNDLKNKTVRDKNRIPHLVSNLLAMIYGYIPNSENDVIRLTRMGFPSLKGFGPKELTMTKEDWEAAGLKRGALPTLTYFDPISQVNQSVPLTINGIEIDIADAAVIRKFNLISSFPPSLMHDAMEVIEVTYNKYFDDSSRAQKTNALLFDILTRAQRVLIITQNLLFADKLKIQDKIKLYSTKIHPTRKEMMIAREEILNNLAMLELADNRLTSHYDTEIVSEMLDAYHDQMGDAAFANLCERLKTSEIVVRLRRDRDDGIFPDVVQFLDELCNVFKQGNEEEQTLESALLASGSGPTRQTQQQPDTQARTERTTSGGASGSGWRKQEVVTTQGADEIQKILNLLLKGMYDIKSELGSLKKLIQPTDTSKHNAAQTQGKPGWRSSEQDGKPEKKTKFANVAAVQAKRYVNKVTSAPQPFRTSRITQIESSEDSDEQTDQFAGIMVEEPVSDYLNFRILTAHHNVTGLGRKCKETTAGSNMNRQGSKHGNPQPVSSRLADSIPTDHPLEALITDQLPHSRETKFSEETMSSIGGQQEMIIVSDDTDRAQAPVKRNDARKRVYNMGSPPPMASAPVIPTMRSPIPSMNSPPCTFSPSTPQVENYADSTGTTLRQSVEATLSEVLETQTRAKNINASAKASKHVFTIPAPAEVSESDEDPVPLTKPKSKRSRSSKSSTARKIIVTTPQGNGEPVVDPRSARLQNRTTKFKLSNTDPSASSAAPSTTTHARSTSTSSVHSAIGDDGSDYDKPPDLIGSSSDDVGSADPDNM